MKIVIREWLKDKRACALIIISFVIQVIYLILNAKITLMIANAITDFTNLWYNVGLISGICIIQVILHMIRSYCSQKAIHMQFTSISDRWADHMLDAVPNMFTKFSVAHISTVQEQIWNIVNVGHNTMSFFLNITNIIVLLYSIYKVGGLLIIPILIVYAVGVLILKVLYKKFNTIDHEADVIKKDRNQDLENVINGFYEVRSFNCEDHFRRDIHCKNHSAFSKFNKRTKVDMYITAAIESIDTAGLIMILLYSCYNLSKGLMHEAQCMSLVMYAFRLLDPLLYVLEYMSDTSRKMSMNEDYNNITTYEETDRSKEKIDIDVFNNEINIENITFSYTSASETIKDINMTFIKGQKIGICGESGSGKSTLFKLLNRFYVPTKGKIMIDGFDASELTNESYRKLIGSVNQENIIFPGSIMYNIKFGSFNATDYEVYEACKKANIYDFIMGLPDRFDTEVGPRGLKLSGGQKQRISLARLFLRDPEIVLLDEATAALDNISEKAVQKAIDNLNNKTVITIAHRLSTIKNCDVIYVMKNNKVVERGTHDQLMELHGEYYNMINVEEYKEE